MITCPMDILQEFPVRKSRQQKLAFREAVGAYARQLGYPCTEEAGSLGARNLLIGDPKNADFLVTAHYDTCARSPVPNGITPCNFWLYLLRQIGTIASMVLLSILVGVAVALVVPGIAPWMISLPLYGAAFLLLRMGPANPSNVNDNTSGVVTLLEIARTLPENQRSKVCFVLFDLEELGLVGSRSYRKRHREETDRQIVLNLDCVGDGDQLRMFPTKALKADRKALTGLYKACGYFGKKSLLVHEKGRYIYPSDQASFPYGVGICALHQGKRELYLSRIHTPRDTVLEGTNVNILRAALTTYLCCGSPIRKETKT